MNNATYNNGNSMLIKTTQFLIQYNVCNKDTKLQTSTRTEITPIPVVGIDLVSIPNSHCPV